MKSDSADSSFTFKKYNPNNSCLPGDRPFLSLAAAGDEIWVGTQKGLVYFNVITGHCSLFEMGTGIPDLAIEHLLLDDNAFLWIGTRNGMGYVQFKH